MSALQVRRVRECRLRGKRRRGRHAVRAGVLSGVVGAVLIMVPVAHSLADRPAGTASTLSGTINPYSPYEPAEPQNLPAKLEIRRARVVGPRPQGRRLIVTGSLDHAAGGGQLELRYRAASQQRRFRVAVDPDGRYRAERQLRGRQRRARAGRLVVIWRGNEVLRPARQGLRAAPRAVLLRFDEGQPRLEGDTVTASGQVRPQAGRRVNVRIKFNRPNGVPVEIAIRTRVNRRGRWRIRRSLPPAALDGARVSVSHPGARRFHGQRIGADLP